MWTLSAAGRTSYQVNIEVTKSSPDPIWIAISGSHGNTLTTILSDHGYNSGVFKQTLNMDFVGGISRVVLTKLNQTSLGIKKLEVF